RRAHSVLIHKGAAGRAGFAASPVPGAGQREASHGQEHTMTAPGAFADVAALRACWHPVAFADSLADRPAHTDLLGEPLVLWRGPDGEPRANSALGVHRGAAPSLGRINRADV